MIAAFCDWLAATPVSQTFQDWAWFVPLVQTVHILCVAVVATPFAMLAFRLLGLTRLGLTLAVMVSQFMPWIWSALAVLLVSGMLLTVTEPARELLNFAFRAKMILVVVLAVILTILQSRLRRDPDYWTRPARRGAARSIGVASLLVEILIVTAGRWIAYV